MKMIWRNLIAILFFLLMISSFTVVSLEAEVNHFSTELKEGKVLSWEYYVHDFNPLKENVLDIIEITIMQDIPDTAIDYDLLYQYFNVSINGEEYKDYIDYKYLVPYFLYPTAYVVDNSTLPLYEYLDDFFHDYTGTSSNYTIQRNKGNIEVNGHKIVPDFYQIFELNIHEQTGVVRHSFNHNIFDDGDQDYTINVTYLGGMKLVNNAFTIVPIVLLGIPLISTIIRRKRKKTQPP